MNNYEPLSTTINHRCFMIYFSRSSPVPSFGSISQSPTLSLHTMTGGPRELGECWDSHSSTMDVASGNTSPIYQHLPPNFLPGM